MQVKTGVVLSGVRTLVIYAAFLYDLARRFAGYGEGTITSGREGSHTNGSLHYTGWAVDLRTNDLPGGSTGPVATALATWLRAALAFWLPGAWTVIQEEDHIHVQRDEP